MKEFMSPEEVADLLSVDRKTIYRWIKKGKLLAHKFELKLIRIRKEDLETFIFEHLV